MEGEKNDQEYGDKSSLLEKHDEVEIAEQISLENIAQEEAAAQLLDEFKTHQREAYMDCLNKATVENVESIVLNDKNQQLSVHSKETADNQIAAMALITIPTAAEGVTAGLGVKTIDILSRVRKNSRR